MSQCRSFPAGHFPLPLLFWNSIFCSAEDNLNENLSVLDTLNFRTLSKLFSCMFCCHLDFSQQSYILVSYTMHNVIYDYYDVFTPHMTYNISQTKFIDPTVT